MIRNKISKRIVLYLVMLVGVIVMYNGFLIMLNNYPALSMLPYRLTVALLGVATLRAVDDFVLTDINTYVLMRRNPIGYAIYIMAYAVIIAAALSGA